MLNPDLWQPWFGGEKPMEMAFLNAILRSAHMPPYDPYYAGGTINYYYYGQFLTAFLMRLAGVRAEVGFNLAVPTLFALTVSGSFVLGYHLAPAGRWGSDGARSHRLAAGRLAAGIATVLLVAVLGNLTTPVQLAGRLAEIGGAPQSQEAFPWGDLPAVGAGLARVARGEAGAPLLDYWQRATRVIPHTINEFPFFSFLFADLHPHMIAIPFTLLLMALLWTWVAGAADEDWRTRALRWALLALALGALGPTNTWDLPTYGALVAAGFVYRGYRAAGRRGLARGALGALGLGVVAVLLYAPYYAHYRPPALGVGAVPAAARSPLGPWLTVWGTHLFLAASLLGAILLGGGSVARRLLPVADRRGVGGTWRRLRALHRGAPWTLGLAAAALLAGAVAGLALAVAGEALVGLLAMLLGAALAALAVAPDREQVFRGALLALGIAIVLGVEVLYLRDFLDGGEWRRMNTLFKFYIQAWVLLSVALGSALPALWARVYRRPTAAGVAWMVAANVLLAAAASYALWAVPQRVEERFPGERPARGTLDGTAFMSTGVYHWPDPSQPIDLSFDREALAWLWDNVPGTPVVAEAGVGYYREGGLRVASFTGLPTIVGMHENEQRPPEEVAARQRDAERLFATTDVAEFRAIAARYGVRYVYVGQLERIVYPVAGLTKFAALAAEGALERVYRNERVDIYHLPAGPATGAVGDPFAGDGHTQYTGRGKPMRSAS